EPLVLEAHRYTITGFDVARGVFRYDRPAGMDKGSTPHRMGFANTADLQWAEDLGAWVLPWRVGPRLKAVLLRLHDEGTSPAICEIIRQAVTSDARYLAGRDDLALADALATHLPR